jgi:TP901 family phage tail tape measure protein
MAVLTSSLVARLIDQVSAPARKIAQSLQGVRDAAGRSQRVSFGDRLNGALERNNAAIDRTRGRLVDAAAGFYGLRAALGAPLTAATDFETVLEDIGQKAEIPQERLRALGASLRKIGREVNQSGAAIAGGMDVLLGMGASEADASALLKPMGRAATAYRASVDDLAKAGFAALDNLKVPANQFAAALDAMAQSGKSGAFELRDMAQYFPSLTAAYQGLNQKGVPAVADLAAALQITRKGAGDSAEAATNLSNILQKIAAPGTRKKFKEMGVDLRKELDKAAKEGMTPIEAIAEITNRTLKGDLGKLSDLFEDAQVQKGLRPLIQNIAEYRRIRAEAMKAQGVVEGDYQRRLQTSAAALTRWKATLEGLSVSIGAALLPALNRLADVLGPIINRVAEFAEANPNLTAALVGSASAITAFRVAAIAASFAGLHAWGSILKLGRGGYKAARLLARATLLPVKASARAGKALVGAARAMRAARVESAAATVATMAGMARTSQAMGRAGQSAKAASQAMISGMSGTRLAAEATMRRTRLAAEAASAAMVAGMGRSSRAIGGLSRAGRFTRLIASVRGLGAAIGGGAFARQVTIGGGALLGLLRPLRLVRGALTGLMLVGRFTLIGAGLTALAAGGMALYNNWNKVKAAAEGFAKGFMAAIEPIKPALQAVTEAVGWLGDKWTALTGTVANSPTKDWAAWGEAAGKATGDALVSVTSLARALQNLDFDLALKIGTPSWAGAKAELEEQWRLFLEPFSRLPSIDLSGMRVTLPSFEEVKAELSRQWDLFLEPFSRLPAIDLSRMRVTLPSFDEVKAELSRQWDLFLEPFSRLPSVDLSAAGRAFVQSYLAGLTGSWTAVTGWLASIARSVPGAVGVINLHALGAQAVASLGEGMKAKAGELLAWAQALPANLAKLPSIDLSAAGSAAFVSLQAGLQARLGDTLAFIAGLPARIAGAVGAIDLSAAGRAVIDSYLAGLKSVWASVTGWLASIAPSVPAAVGAVDLRGVGVQALTSLWEGMKSAFGGLLAWAKSIPAQIRAAIGSISIAPKISMPSLPSVSGGAAKPSAGASGSWEGPAIPKVDGARAGGGPVWRGGEFWVGEEGPEIFKPKTDGHITPADQSRRAPSSASASADRPTVQPAAASGGRGGATLSAQVNLYGSNLTAEDVVRALERKFGDMMHGSYGDLDPRPV